MIKPPKSGKGVLLSMLRADCFLVKIEEISFSWGIAESMESQLISDL